MKFQKAFLKAEKAIESLYFDTFSMYGFKEVQKPNGSISNVPNQLLIKDAPCKVYQKARAGTTAVTDGQDPHLSYETKLMCNTSYNVLGGSRYVVTDVHGNVREYVRADEGFEGYVTHQEITIIRQRDVTETVPLTRGDGNENL